MSRISNISTALIAALAIGAVSITAATMSEPATPAPKVTGMTVKKAVTGGNRDRAAGGTAPAPDFAFPDKVAADAGARLDKALASGDGREVVTSLVEYALAKNEISQSLLPPVIARIDSVAAIEKDPCVSSLLYLLEAHIYDGLYNRDRWNYDRREIPLQPLAPDYTEWSGEQFKNHIASLLDKACAPRRELLASPLEDWKDIIAADEYTPIFYPTLYDLVAYSSIDILMNFSRREAILPVRFLSADLLMLFIPANADIDRYSRTAQQLAVVLAESHRDRIPALITARIKGLQIMQMLVYIDDDTSARLNAYLELYDEYAHHDWADEILIACNDNQGDRYAATVKKAIERFPDYFRVNALKQKYAVMTQPAAYMSHDRPATPGVPFDVTLTMSNTTKATINLYRSPNGFRNTDKPVKFTANVVENPTVSIPVEIADPGRLPFNADTVVPITLPAPGIYYAWITVEGDNNSTPDPQRTLYNDIICADFTPVTMTLDGTCYPYALDSRNGAPLPGVAISASKRNDKAYLPLGKTNNEGTLDKPATGFNRFRFTKGDQILGNAAYTYRHGEDEESTNARCFTSLPLYHHGDSLQWAIVAYRSTADASRQLPNKSLTIKFKDANYETFLTDTVTTDATGRATGTIVLPAEGLSGSYSMTVYDKGNSIATTHYTVNDYKMPTFTAAIDDVQRYSNPDSSVVVKCKAMTYSGFPVIDSRVDVTLEAMRSSWWYSSTTIKFWSTATSTDKDGIARIILPDSLLKLSPIIGGTYRISFNVTSPAGETRSCSSNFALGKPLTLAATGNHIIDLGKPLAPLATAYDANRNEAAAELVYRLMLGNRTVATLEPGRMIPGQVKPGTYSMKIFTRNPAMADTLTLDRLVLYKDHGICPVEEGIFLPLKSVAASRRANLTYGVPYKDAHLLVAEVVDGKMRSRRWVKASAGMNMLPVDIPADCRVIQLMISMYRDNRLYSESATITNSAGISNLDIVVESFRDKVIPGTPESITLNVKMNGTPAEAAMMLLMQSQALLDIEDASPFEITLPRYFTPRAGINTSASYINVSTGKDIPSFTYPTYSSPGLNLYGLSFGSPSNLNGIMIRGLSRKLSATGARNDAVDEDLVLYETVTMDAPAAAVADMGQAKMETADAVETEEEADGSEDGATQGPGEKDSFKYRPTEIPLAFFAPMLSTDAQGNLTYTYTVPDANTTWKLKALAYTPDMLSTSLSRAVTSSRPVMVQSNPTRFLRYGDHTELRATVMNATDSTRVISTTVSILRADDMTMMKSMTSVDTVAPHQSVTVGIPVEAPLSGQALIYRVKGATGNYSDGEQTIIPLLPASQPVIRSQAFFIAPDTTAFTMQLPVIEGDNISTLYMYDNPLWEVVTALPSLSEGDTKTSTGAANDLYMAAMARGIMKKNPALKRALAEWLESDRSDSTLTSMLQRNDRLKQLSINATPWVQEAMSDRARLDRLALLLDDGNLNSTINRAVKSLKELQCDDGGLSWCPGFKESSMWATCRFLTLMASLQSHGYMPDLSQLSSLTNRAIDYIDSQVERSMKQDKRLGDYTAYSYVRSLLRGKKKSPVAQQAISLTVKNILKRWKKESTPAKGIDAVILYYNGYPTMAREIVRSINSYSMSSIERGQWWDNLGVNVAADLLHTIEIVTPDDKKSIQAVAQWLILSKTNQAWGNCVCTSSTIDAVLGAIDVDKAVNGKCEVYIDNEAVESDTPQMPGMTVADISSIIAGDKAATLSVTKNTGLQAMGSVITRYIQDMDHITASAHPSVSIEKRTTVVRGTAVEEATDLKVGDRVRTQLIIKVLDDLDYVTVVDRRAACLEPADQLSGYRGQDGMWFYREVTDSETRLYIYNLTRGTYVIDTEMYIVAEGRFTSGVATLQSQINPGVSANSAAQPLTVHPDRATK